MYIYLYIYIYIVYVDISPVYFCPVLAAVVPGINKAQFIPDNDSDILAKHFFFKSTSIYFPNFQSANRPSIEPSVLGNELAVGADRDA